MTKIIIETSFYNERRYGRPYIALCDAEAKVKVWGAWIGTPGNAGELSIEVPDTPCIIMQGQKDTRGNNSAPKYSLVIDGKLSTSDWTANKMSVIKELRKALAEKKG